LGALRSRFGTEVRTVIITGKSPTVPPLPPDVEETVCKVASEDEMFGELLDAIVPHYGCDNLYVTVYLAVYGSGVSVTQCYGEARVAPKQNRRCTSPSRLHVPIRPIAPIFRSNASTPNL